MLWVKEAIMGEMPEIEIVKEIVAYNVYDEMHKIENVGEKEVVDVVCKGNLDENDFEKRTFAEYSFNE